MNNDLLILYDFILLFNYFQLLDFFQFFTFVSNIAVNILTYSSVHIKKLFLKISSQKSVFCAKLYEQSWAFDIYWQIACWKIHSLKDSITTAPHLHVRLAVLI